MKEFKSTEEAFVWFLENVFPKLSTKDKIKLKDVKYCYYSEDRKVSEKRMKRVLSEFGDFEIVYRFGWKSK